METEVKDKQEQSQDTPPVAGQPSADKKPTLKTILEADHIKAISDERAISGRLKSQLEAVTKERDILKTQTEETTTAVEETRTKIAELESDLETLSEENASTAEINKIKKRLAETETQLRRDLKAKQDAADAEKEAARTERQEHAGEVSEARALKLVQSVIEVAEEFEDGNAEKLKSLCEDRIEASGKPMSRDDVEKLASKLWNKKIKPEDKEPALINDSGMTSGGGLDLSKLSARELFVLGQKKKK